MTTGQLLVSYSSLSSGTALSHLSHIVGGSGIDIQVPVKVDTIPFSIKNIDPFYPLEVINDSFNAVKITSNFNDYIVADTFIPIKAIKFNIKEAS